MILNSKYWWVLSLVWKWKHIISFSPKSFSYYVESKMLHLFFYFHDEISSVNPKKNVSANKVSSWVTGLKVISGV